MSVYGYLACLDCRHVLWLGKALRNTLSDAGAIRAFHQGGADQPPSWSRESVSRQVWQFLAGHCGHSLRVLLDDELVSLESEGGFTDVSQEPPPKA
jgi:hypothetical protein